MFCARAGAAANAAMSAKATPETRVFIESPKAGQKTAGPNAT
jgi:hypothetical protein